MPTLPLRSLLLALGLLAAGGADAGETNRQWRNADASASFEGEYLSHDARHVTIRRSNGRVVSLDLDKLHDDDRRWLAARTPEAKLDAEPPVNPNAVFDTLCFGDSRKDVETKLKSSKLVEATIDETFFGRFGLNGSFRTVKQIGGLHCELFFDFSPENHLREVSLQTQSLGRDSYGERLRKNWSELAELLTMLHGKPVQAADYPPIAELQDGTMLASHLWQLEGGGSALLGTSMDLGKYRVVVRFTTEKITPVRTP